MSDAELIAKLQGQVNVLRAFILSQKELWLYVKDDLNKVDDRNYNPRRMEILSPIEDIDEMLGRL